jgi:hypothetical protein
MQRDNAFLTMGCCVLGASLAISGFWWTHQSLPAEQKTAPVLAEPAEPEPSVQAPRPSTIPILTFNLNDLFAAYRTNQIALYDNYLDKQLYIIGRISLIPSSLDQEISGIVLDDYKGHFGFCYFDASHRPQLAKLIPDHEIKILGAFRGEQYDRLVFTHCQVISVDAVSASTRQDFAWSQSIKKLRGESPSKNTMLGWLK